MKNPALFIVAASFAALAASAENYVWNGGASGEWNAAANWTPNGTPGAGDVATFNVAAEITDGIVIDNGTLTVERNAEVKFMGAIVDGESGAGALDLTGAGKAHLYGDNTFSGGLTASGTCATTDNNDGTGSVCVHRGNALGAGVAYLDTCTGPRLYVDGGLTVTTEIKLGGSNRGNTGYISITGSAPVTFKEKITAFGVSAYNYGSSKLYFYGNSSTAYTFEKDVESGEYTFGNGKMHFYGPTKFGTYYWGWECHYHTNNNRATNFAFRSDDTYCYADDALVESADHWEFVTANGKVHLDGHDQTVKKISSNTWQYPAGQRIGQPNFASSTAHGFESPVDKPAVITFALANCADVEIWYGQFYGAAGLCWNPAIAGKEFCFSNTVQTTCGSVLVSNGVVSAKCGAGFSSLRRVQLLDVAANGKFRLDASGVDSFFRHVNVDGKIFVGAGRRIECTSATFGGAALADGTYKAADCPEQFEGDGEIVVNSVFPNSWVGGESGNWSDASGWFEGHVPQAGERVAIAAGSTVTLDADTAELAELNVAVGATLVMSGWSTCLKATNVVVGGTVTTPGAFTTDDPAHRVWIKCGDLTVSSGGKIDVDAKGWDGGVYKTHPRGYGPGAIDVTISGNSGEAGGAGHGGRGSVKILYKAVMPLYDDPFAPALPGSGGLTIGSSAGEKGTAGGGAVRVEATGTVRVDGGVLASAGDVSGIGKSSCSGQWAGSGGAIWIKCAKFEGDGGVVKAKGGDGDVSTYPLFVWYYINGADGSESARAGGGGMIRIETGAEQSSAALKDMTVSADAGVHRGLKDGLWALTLANHDMYRTEADLGTVTFSDNVLIDQLLGKGLSGTLTGVSSYVYPGAGLNWTAGHVRFPGTAEAGADVTVNGDLSVSGESRLEIGGIETATNRTLWINVYAGTHPNKLSVNGDLTLASGSALDVRACCTNGVDQWGGEVTTTGDLVVGGGAYLYPWCDPMNLGAPRFVVGGDFTVAEGGTVMADRRGGLGGRGGSSICGWFLGKGSSESGYGIGASVGTGASHGGVGGNGWKEEDGVGVKCETPGKLVADEWTAAFPGAGGGAAGYGTGGDGGGLVYVDAQGAVTVDGLVTADGWCNQEYTGLGGGYWLDGYCTLFGAGAGGGIHLSGATFAGKGEIRARGGNGISGYVAGTGDNVGKTYGYGSGAGGGGRVAILTGVDLAGQDNVGVYKSAFASEKHVAKTCAFDGTIDVAGGHAMWNARGKSGAPVQFAACLGGEGTIRYVAVARRPGTVLLVR